MPMRGVDSPPTISLPHGATNRYLSQDADAAFFPAAEGYSANTMLKSFAMSGALQFASTCLAMPFEVGKILLQVQWVPTDQVWDQMQASKSPSIQRQLLDPDEDDPLAEEQVWEDDGGDDEGNDRPERYFRELWVPTTLDEKKTGPKRRTDPHGYVLRAGKNDHDARPEFIMPMVVKGGVWEMIKAVARGKEGWMGLWKGTLTTFLLDTATSTLQPLVSGLLSLFSPAAMNPVPIAFSPQPVTRLSLLMVSHLVTGVLVSPLDLVRTRLVAQTTMAMHRKYHGPLDAIRTILREEGGWGTTYLHANLLIPTVLDYLFRPLLTLGAPWIIENILHLDPSTVPISYALAELIFSTLALCVTLPIETVRRRLQLQYHEPRRATRSGGLPAVRNTNTARRGLRTCVEVRPVPYNGVVEAMYRILTEETSVAPHVHRKRRAKEETMAKMASSVFSFGGLRNLYRGLGMGISANLLVFVLTVVTGERQTGSTGWTEM